MPIMNNEVVQYLSRSREQLFNIPTCRDSDCGWGSLLYDAYKDDQKLQTVELSLAAPNGRKVVARGIYKPFGANTHLVLDGEFAGFITDLEYRQVIRPLLVKPSFEYKPWIFSNIRRTFRREFEGASESSEWFLIGLSVLIAANIFEGDFKPDVNMFLSNMRGFAEILNK